METFVEYVSAKEIVHSRIIAEFLDPNGSHHLGSRFLQSFLADFCPGYDYAGMKDIQITTERYIPSNRRKIDIFIEWGCKSGAIIIENKLNEAQYQPNQLEDYGNSIKSEGYARIHVICIHKNRRLIVPNAQFANKILYPMDIAKCFEKTLDNSKESQCIISYITLLKNMHKNNIIMENAKRLLELDPSTLMEITQLVQAYNNIPQAKSEIIGDILQNKYHDIKIELKKGYYLQIWNEKDYQINKCWITVCLWEDCYSLYITTFQDDITGMTKIKAAEYTNKQTSNYWDWYSSRDERKRFPLNTQLNDVITEVERLLGILSEQ
ncbi:MAG: PD-(D/E)XK nuclease family protein [Bacteroidales bacterium]|nr:PD-(D/E)XK nuclease family protein [Bacteroidales bacterium]